MFIKLKGQSYDFLYASINRLTSKIEMGVQVDDKVHNLEIEVEGSITVALQVIASILSKYQMVTDINKELATRGIFIKSAITESISDITKQKEPLGVEKTEVLNDTVAISPEGIYLIKELALTLDGVYIITSKGYKKLLDIDMVTETIFEHMQKELTDAYENKTIYVVS